MFLPSALRNASITSLPLASVKSPVCERMIFMRGSVAMMSAKPFLRSIAGAEPTVPCNSTMLIGPGLPFSNSSSQRPARLPSSMKSEPMNVTYRLVSLESTARSVRITGMWAALASISTVSQPDSTTGDRPMTSTFCAMNERIALIWFSCFCWPSENFSSMPASLAACLIDSVLAVRQALSAPTWLKPSTIFFCASAIEGVAKAAATRVAARTARR